jgi:hypothetical protein
VLPGYAATLNAMAVTSRRVGAIMAALMVLSGNACTRDGGRDFVLREHASEFVPDDAADKVTASDLPWVQISFTVRRPPLEFAIDEGRLRDAVAKGWSLCRPRTTEWEGYADATVTPAGYMQHRVYILHKDGILIMLTGLYRSTSEQAAVGKRTDEADMPIQQVIVTARRAPIEEVAAMAAAQGLFCDKQPGSTQ